jgi:hypothetical protein
MVLTAAQVACDSEHSRRLFKALPYFCPWQLCAVTSCGVLATVLALYLDMLSLLS